MKYQANLDSIRGVAALAVVLFHWQRFVAFGWIGVELFFALSGYLITGILLEKKARGNQGFGTFFRSFMLHRVLRLVPLYLGFFIIIGPILAHYQSEVLATALPYIATYAVNLGLVVYRFPETWNAFAHTWSLDVEWQFYLLWPFVVWLFSRRNLGLVLAAIVVVAPLARLVTYLVATRMGNSVADPAFAAKTVYCAPWSHFDALAWGALLHWGSTREWFTSRRGSLVTGGLVVCSAVSMTLLYGLSGSQGVASLGFPLHLPNGYEFVWGYSFIAIASAWAIAQAGRSGTRIHSFLDNALLRYLGKISYGIYVFHFPIALALLKSNWIKNSPKFSGHSLVGLFVLLSLTLSLSHLSYVYFESFFLKPRSSARSRGPVVAMTLAPEESGSGTR